MRNKLLEDIDEIIDVTGGSDVNLEISIKKGAPYQMKAKRKDTAENYKKVESIVGQYGTITKLRHRGKCTSIKGTKNYTYSNRNHNGHFTSSNVGF